MTATKKLLFYIFVSVLLVLVYPLDLYFPTGNQCIYFFWGIKDTGFGFLENDFLAAQPDPFPLFSWLVQYSCFFGSNSFLLWYWLLNLVYVVAVFEIMEVVNTAPSPLERAGVRLLLFLFAHSTLIWGFFFSRFAGIDLRWAWDSGFAEQGLLRGYLQPSVFGVFILLSFALFIKRRFLPAFIAAALAACFHANYLLVSGVFIAVYLLVLLKEKNYKQALIGSIVSLLVVLPYLYYVYKNFGSSSPATIAYIKDHIKGHLHFDPQVWMNTEAFLQLILICIALWFVRKTTLFFPLLIALLILIALTILTYLSGSIFLLNLTPWRISVVLVPIAVSIVVFSIAQSNTLTRNIFISFALTATVSALFFRVFGNSAADFMLKWRTITVILFVILFLLIYFTEKKLPQQNIKTLTSVSVCLLLVVLGLSGIFMHQKGRTNEAEVILFAKENATKKQQYLIPPKFIDFRLAAGVPVFVDSSIYHSNALPEWERRIQVTNRLFKTGDTFLLDSLVKHCGITHIIAENGRLEGAGRLIYQNKRYTIFEVDEQ